MCTKDLTVLFIGEFPHTLAQLVVHIDCKRGQDYRMKVDPKCPRHTPHFDELNSSVL